jgi:hypothetical protein
MQSLRQLRAVFLVSIFCSTVSNGGPKETFVGLKVYGYRHQDLTVANAFLYCRSVYGQQDIWIQVSSPESCPEGTTPILTY